MDWKFGGVALGKATNRAMYFLKKEPSQYLGLAKSKKTHGNNCNAY